MHPYLFGKIPSYSVMMIIGILAAVLLFRFLCAKKRVPGKIYDYYATAAIVSIAVGLGSAFLFQAVYNLIDTGKFEFRGLTFMGGLIGGTVTFVLFGLLSKKPERKAALLPVAELAAPCIALAHAIGRIGCFLAGCCYGKPSDGGVYIPSVGAKVIPTQAVEAAFLFVLFGVLLWFTLSDKVKGFNLAAYAVGYSIFRFIIEFFRDDYRGSFIPGLSPSQFQSIVLLFVGIFVAALRLKRPDLFSLRTQAEADSTDKNAETQTENTVTETENGNENSHTPTENYDAPVKSPDENADKIDGETDGETDNKNSDANVD